MDYPLRHEAAVGHEHPLVRPWRNAALAAALVAVVELVLLVVIGGALLAKPDSRSSSHPATRAKADTGATPAAAQKPHPAPAVAAKLPRGKVSVLVLNGNGRQGAAAAQASRVSAKGYRIGGVANASSEDYTRSLVMYRPGFEGEGKRLARDLGINIVGPLDGMRPSQLKGANTVVVVGS
jgi:LytR cell envelope-related transcriptional attenuator